MKNNKVRAFIKNFGYALGSNLTSLLVSTLLVLVLPKVIGVEEYGYWQIYIFYLGYVGFFHFGWNDGIYLRYAGKNYEELDKKLFHSQFWMLVIFECIVAITIVCLSGVILHNPSKMFIFDMIAICCLLVIPRSFLEYVLQFTNRIQAYSKILLLDRIFYCAAMILAVVVGIDHFKYLILLDIFAKIISLAYAAFQCRDIVIRNRNDFSWNLRETIQNVNVGIKLMVANMASLLIIGIVRICIENTWSVEVFGKISLTISISNMFVMLVSALGMVIFPLIRRMSIERLREIYILLNNVLVVPLLGVLILYFPVRYFMSAWLPQYEEGLRFMAILFPICLFEGKMSLLINTYLKALRKEKQLLIINMLSVLVSTVCSIIFVLIKKDLFLGVCTILIVIAFREIIAEIFLTKTLDVKILRNIVLEMLMTVNFVICGYFMSEWMGMVFYFASYCLYLVIQKHVLVRIKHDMRILIKREE